MVPISAYYLGQDPPNASTLRETIQQIRQPAEDRMAPPPATPLTANGTGPLTPSSVPHIDAQTGETRTGGVSVREGVPGSDKALPPDGAETEAAEEESGRTSAPGAKEAGPATALNGEEAAEKEAALRASHETGAAQRDAYASAAGGGAEDSLPPTPLEKDVSYSNAGVASVAAASTGYSQAQASPQSRNLAGDNFSGSSTPTMAAGNSRFAAAQSEARAPADVAQEEKSEEDHADEGLQDVNLDDSGEHARSERAEDEEEPAEEEIDLS